MGLKTSFTYKKRLLTWQSVSTNDLFSFLWPSREMLAFFGKRVEIGPCSQSGAEFEPQCKEFFSWKALPQASLTLHDSRSIFNCFHDWCLLWVASKVKLVVCALFFYISLLFSFQRTQEPFIWASLVFASSKPWAQLSLLFTYLYCFPVFLIFSG